MGDGYVRQSAAEIVNGEVANDSDFNNEFNALLAAFHASTGHSHDGTTGEGPLISLSGSVSGALGATNGGVISSASDPTANDDTGDSYRVGQIWLNTTSKALFIATDVTAAAAVWVKQNARVTGSAPAVTDDIDQGYRPGSIWVDTSTTPDTMYICTDNTNGAAVWLNPAPAVSIVGTAFSELELKKFVEVYC